MAVHIEFVVLGPPISNQSPGPNLVAWRTTIAGEASAKWAAPLLTGKLKAVVINFYAGNRPSVDVDNMSKPILDEMQSIIYEDDRQIRQAEISHVELSGAFAIAGVSKIVVDAIQANQQFVYVRIEDPVDPFPLPK